MLSFTQFLKEAGDTPLPFRSGKTIAYGKSKQYNYGFDHEGKKFKVIVNHFVPHSAHVEFSAYDTHHPAGTLDLTGDHGSKAARVMSTIHNIVKHHVKNHPELKTVSFTSENSEPSRVRLYKLYANKHGGHTEADRDEHYHEIPADAYRSRINESLSPLSESGDFHYPFEPVKLRFGPGYTFKGRDNKYIILPQEKIGDPNNRKLHVTFMTDGGNVGKTGNAGADSGKILSTVHHIVAHHISQKPDIHTVVFTSDNREPSRQKLYDRYTTKLGGYSVPGRHETTHFVPANSYKKVNENIDDDKPVRIQLGRKADGKRAQAFMDEYHSDSQEHPFAHTARILHGAVVEASKDGNEVHIHDIRTTSPRSGAGTKALKHLTNLADKHNVKLNLFAKAYSNSPDHINNTERLVKWYEKHGFQHEEPDYDESWGSDMKYYPK